MKNQATKLAVTMIIFATAACGVESADDLDGDAEEESSEIVAATSSSIVTTSGTRAGEAFFNPGSPPFIDLFDAKCDNRQVYVEYQQNGGFTTRVNNGSGCNTTRRINVPDGKGQIVYRVFVDVQLGSDIPGVRAIDFDL